MNPSEDSPPPKAPTVSIPTEDLSLRNGQQVLPFSFSEGMILCSWHDGQSITFSLQGNSYVLLLRVSAPGSNTESEPQTKRRRLSELASTAEEAVRLYGAELVVYDRHSRCLLVDGDYELAMKEIGTCETNRASPVGGTEKSPFKANASWSSLDTPIGSPVRLLAQNPLLKFRLEWANESIAALVDR